MVVDIIVAASVGLTLAVVLLTTKFSREMPINKTFDELWFENPGQEISEEQPMPTKAEDISAQNSADYAKAA